jgi:hypothetical protein
MLADMLAAVVIKQTQQHSPDQGCAMEHSSLDQ